MRRLILLIVLGFLLISGVLSVTFTSEEIDASIDSQENEIAELQQKAETFNIIVKTPFWVEGIGEAVLNQSNSVEKCQQLCVKNAKLNALESGKQIIKESLKKEGLDSDTDFELYIQEEDNSNGYGEILVKTEGKEIKYTVKVRLKMQAIDFINHYQEELNRLTSKRPELTYTIQKDGESWICIANSDGTGVKRLCKGNRPVWSPDGEEIFFTTTKKSKGMFYLITLILLWRIIYGLLFLKIM